MEKKNKMETMHMQKLVINMSLPLIVSLLVQSLYNIVDSIFVAKMSEEALTTTSLAFPVQMLMIAFSVGTSVGVNALLSKTLGARNRERATRHNARTDQWRRVFFDGNLLCAETGPLLYDGGKYGGTLRRLFEYLHDFLLWKFHRNHAAALFAGSR